MRLNGGDRKSVSHTDQLKLKDIGIDYNQSKRWQASALLPEADFERHILETREAKNELTSAAATVSCLGFVFMDLNHRSRNQVDSNSPNEQTHAGYAADKPVLE